MDGWTFLHLAGLVLIMLPYLTDGAKITRCTYDPGSCSCETNLGDIYLDQASKDIPYNATNKANLHLYYWDPCKDFTIGSTTAGCVEKVLASTTKSVGTHHYASSNATGGYAVFTMRTANDKLFTYVKCVCGEGDTFTFASVKSSKQFHFVFTSTACCPGAPRQKSSFSSISTGSILVITLFAILVLYLAIGTVIQVAVRKAQGRERVPNVSLWASLPGLIRDGFIFTVTRGQRSVYQKI